MTSTAVSTAPPVGRWSRAERARLGGIVLAVAVLHIAGWSLYLYWNDQPAAAGGLAGAGTLAYVLGVRHAFDADHIAAIDDTTRLMLLRGRRPVGVGFFFALGHSAVVLLLALIVGLASTSLTGAGLEQARELGATVAIVTATLFLALVAALNAVVLGGLARLWRRLRHGRAGRAGAGPATAQPGADAADPRRPGPGAGPLVVAHGPGRVPLRPRPGDRQRGDPAGAVGEHRCRRRPAGAGPAHPAAALRRRDVRHGHRGQPADEPRLLVGVPAAGPAVVLQPGDHRDDGSGRRRWWPASTWPACWSTGWAWTRWPAMPPLPTTSSSSATWWWGSSSLSWVGAVALWKLRGYDRRYGGALPTAEPAAAVEPAGRGSRGEPGGAPDRGGVVPDPAVTGSTCRTCRR